MNAPSASMPSASMPSASIKDQTRRPGAGDDAPEPIAVIGMDCIFPGAADLAQYWANILHKVSAIGEPLPGWRAPLYRDERRSTVTANGGYLGELYRVDPRRHGIPPSSIDGGEPDQFLALEVARRALGDAGAQYLDSGFDHGATGIILGHSPYYHRGQVSTAQHHVFVEQMRAMLHALNPALPPETEARVVAAMTAQLPPFNVDISPGLVPNVMTGRIANRLNLRGPNYLIDAACASSLLSVNAAMEELRRGTSRMMLAGGVNASLPAEVAIIFSQLGALSGSGGVRPFSSGADGTLLGEGLGVVVLKRLSDALEDGDRIYACVRAVGQSSDGRGFGLLAPSQSGEALAIRRSYASAGLDTGAISLIEAHGTGIPLGDRTEIAALTEVFGPRDDLPAGDPGIALGSVKSMISHCIPAAGIASFIKTALAHHHRIQPPTLCDEISDDLGLAESRMFINTAPRPWLHDPAQPRRSGINSFGFGGVNAHAILEDAPAEAPAPADLSPRSAELFVLEAADADALRDEIATLRRFIAARPDAAPAALAAELARRAGAAGAQGDKTCRLALVAGDLAALSKALDKAETRLAKTGSFVLRGGIACQSEPIDGGIVFMFPGEGSQYPGMMAGLARALPPVRAWLDFWAAEGIRADGSRMTDLLYPPESRLDPATQARAEAAAHDMDVGSQAAFVAGQAMFAAMTALGIRADAMVGHSTGESGALIAAEIVRPAPGSTLAEGFRALTGLNRTLDDDGAVARGTLIAAGLLPRAQVQTIAAAHDAVIAMDNCPNQIILFAPETRAETLVAALSDAGAICEILPFDRAYHTPHFAPMADAFAEFYSAQDIAAPRVPLYSCATAAPFPETPEDIVALAARQWISPVRFAETVERLHADGYRYFVEVGPGAKLTGFVEQTLGGRRNGRDFIAASGNLRGQDDMATLLALVGQLWVNRRAGLDGLFAGRRIAALSLDDLSPPALPGIRIDNSIPMIEPTAPLLEALRAALDAAQPAPPTKPPATMAPPPNLSETPPLPITAAPSGAPPAQPAGSAMDLPFLTRIIALQPGQSLHAESDLSLRHDQYLRDHVLSGPVSDDPALIGASCMPLMAALEAMAEAAACALGREDLAAIEQVAGQRFILPDDDGAPLTLTLTAQRRDTQDPGTESCDVVASIGGARAVSCRVIFGPPTPEAALPPPVTPERAHFAAEPFETYREHIFHGPIFQTVEHLTAWSRSGIEATVPHAPLDGFFTPGQTPRFLFNPALLDALTQITAFWLAEDQGTRFASFPRVIRRIDFLSPDISAEDGFLLRGSREGAVEHGQDGVWRLAAWRNGQPAVVVSGLENAHSALPDRFYYYSLEPINGWLGHPRDHAGEIWDMPLIAPEFWTRMNGLFARVLAFSTLSRAERALWLLDAGQSIDWLLPRLAAKELIRFTLAQISGERVHAADIPLAELTPGLFVVTGNLAEAIALDAVTVSTGPEGLTAHFTPAPAPPAPGPVPPTGKARSSGQEELVT